MKTLIINIKDSVFKYQNIYTEYEFELSLPQKDILTIYKRDPITGYNTTIASFRHWDYFIIEDDNEL